MKLACPMQHRRNYQSKILMKVLKLKSVNFKMSESLKFLWLVYDSSKNVMNCDFCRKAGPAMLHRAGQFHYQLIYRFIFNEEFL
jgi:hypothetical protein